MLILPHRRIYHRQTPPPPDIITDGLVHRWVMDEGSGSAVVDTIGGPQTDMTLTGGPLWVPGLTPRYSAALEFDGVAQRGDTNNTSMHGIFDGEYTTMVFVRLLSRNSNIQMATCYQDYRLAICPVMSANPNWGANLQGPWNVVSSLTLTVGTVYHLCFARGAASFISLFANGNKDDNQYPNSFSYINNRNFTVGVGTNGNFPCHCQLNDFRVYTRRLSDAEVAQVAAGNG